MPTLDYRAPPIETEYALLARTLPHGRAWNAKYDRTRVLGRLVRAFAEEIHRLFRAVEEFVLVELDPATTHQLLLEWEKSVGIPDKCFGRAADEATRRLHVQKKLANFGDPITRADIEGILEFFGEPIDIVPGREIYGADLGFGAPPYTDDEVKQIRHTALVRVGSTAESFPLDFPIVFGGSSNTIVECLMNRLLPANIDIQFLFGEDLSQPFKGKSFNAVGTTITGGTAEIGSGVSFAATGAVATAGTSLIRRLRGVSATGATATAGTAAFNSVPPTPNSAFFTGQEFWYDAALSTIGESGGAGTGVSSYSDLTAAARNLAQSTPGRRPLVGSINGNVSLLHDGADDEVDTNNFATSFSAAEFSFAIIVTPTTVTGINSDAFRLRQADNTNQISFRRNDDDLNVFYGNPNGGTALNLGLGNCFVANATRWFIVRLRDGDLGTSDILSSTGLTASGTGPTGPSTAIDQLFLGASDGGLVPWVGHIHGFFGMSIFWSTAQRAAVARYLNSRWTLS